ncbi:MAG TPA: DUF3305 domain-containing protein [Rubrivivax sp.]|nr:DUF3305 domain-containing protein [Rubrivivax sp.]
MHASTTKPSSRPGIQVAVLMERVAAPNRWEDWHFDVLDVVPDEGAFGGAARCLHDDGRRSQWLHPGYRLELYADECKGYFLNLTSGHPVWFVVWRHDENDASRAAPLTVSVSYIEADRWMAAGEHVDSVPLADALCEWLRVFTNENFRPEPPRRNRGASFLSPKERDELMRRETEPRP